jgi:hypothetical protein
MSLSGELYYARSSSNLIPEEQIDGVDSVATFTGSFSYDTVGLTGSYKTLNLVAYNDIELMRYSALLHTRFVLSNFSYEILQRSNFKNSWPTSLKSTNVVWIMRGKKQLDNDFITWRSPDNPGTGNAGYEIVSGTEKVIGYFYDDT